MTGRRIAELPNLGKVSARQLAGIGIENEADLRAAGAVATYVRLRFSLGGSISLNMLWALHGAIEGVDWRRVDRATKERLKAALPPP